MEQLAARYAHNVEVGDSSSPPATMTDEQNKEIEQYLADTIMERPYGFSVGDRHFALYPVSLGKMYLLQRHISNLEMNTQGLQRDLSLEALRLAKTKRSECLNIIYFHTCRKKDEIFDNARMMETTSLFEKEMSEEDVAALMIMVLSSDKTDMFIKHLCLDKEQNRMSTVMKVKEKSDKNNITFGGLSLYGSFIQPLIEMGMTWDEILWERSYTNLRLLLADKVNSIYVSDDERRKIPAWALGNGKSIKADNPKNKELIKNMSWK